MHRIVASQVSPMAAIGLSMLVLAACVQRPLPVIETSTGEVIALQPWAAVLSARTAVTHDAAARHASVLSRGMSGRVTLAPGRTIQETRAVISIAGGSPVNAHPWFVHLGQCGNDRGILAGLAAYPSIEIDQSGHGTAVATLPFTIPTSGRYFVTVRRSESDVSTIIACGELSKGSSGRRTMIAHAKP